jgi:phosphoglucosamine mutase
VKEKKSFKDIKGLPDLLVLSGRSLKNRGRINLRYSGTEPLARIMVEGENESLITEIAQEIASVIERDVGE